MASLILRSRIHSRGGTSLASAVDRYRETCRNVNAILEIEMCRSQKFSGFSGHHITHWYQVW